MAESIYDKASKIIEGRKKTREAELERRRIEVFSKIPRLKEIEIELDRYGIRMLNLIASGEYDEERAVAGIMKENKAFVEERNNLLLKNGYNADYLSLPFVCDDCRDTGFIGGSMCGCLEKELISCALDEANLSEKMADQTFDKFNLSYYSDEYDDDFGCSPRKNMEAILSDCIDYAENFERSSENLLFCGGCGLGKTYLSSAIANALIKKGVDVLYVSSNALFPILEDMHFGRDVTERATYIIKKINECDLLILDDLGSEFVTQFTCAELFRIINNRLLNGSKMIISTNLNRCKLSELYTQRIASRISGSFSLFEFFGSDIRSIKKLQNKCG